MGLQHLSLFAQIFVVPAALTAFYIAQHIARQVLFVDKSKPPVVFSWLPLVGSTIEYGIDPYKFYFKYQKKFGNVFSFVLIGRKHTVCLGPEGNNFVFNGPLNDISAADIYRDLTVPIFGKDVCYDCSPAKLMEQKKFMKYSLTQDMLRSYVPIFLDEVQGYVEHADCFQGDRGVFDVVENIAPLTLFTAAASLQGKEVRQNLDGELSSLYHDLDRSFIPINFYMPGLPIPINRNRDKAHKKIVAIYQRIIDARRSAGGNEKHEGDDDMIWCLMRSTYKNGLPVPDHEIAHMMIGLLMAGQHNTYSVASWILFRLATRPELQEDLYQEQLQNLGLEISATRADMDRLPLHMMVVRETLRLHAPIHTVMRAVKSPLMIVTKDPKSQMGRVYKIPPSHVLISAPGVSARSDSVFPDPETWEPRRWKSITDLHDDGDNTDSAKDALFKGATSSYLPFGAGRHRCVGEMFAYLQLSVITAYLVHNFKFSNPPGVNELPQTDYNSMITRPVTPARLAWERRK